MSLDLKACSSPTDRTEFEEMEFITPQSINKIDSANLKQNVDNLIQCFQSKFNKKPELVVRVPGRVNLIGEHIDYCGFPVCPVALNKRYILVAAAADDSSNAFVKFTNMDSAYPDAVIDEYEPKLKISVKEQGWISYLLCGIQGIIDKNEDLKVFIKPKNMLIAVNGSIPAGAGLSSSSALVCGAFIVTGVINGILNRLSKIEIASLCASAEHYIGTAGGGMDQAIAINAHRGTAKLVKFNPLRVQDIALPPGAVVIIATSHIKKHKAESNEFNTRVVECRLAGQVLAKCGGVEEWKELDKLASVKKALDLSFPEMFNYVDKVLHNEPYSKQEICEGLEITEEELDKMSLTPDTAHIQYFKLKQRANHVFGEAERVFLWRNWCAVGKKLDDLGVLMQRSHSSLQQLYECSHPDLDKLVSICTLAGAYGARVTGAGWGGSVVALVPGDCTDSIRKALDDMYYTPMQKDVNKSVFIVEPGDGAQIFTV